VLRWNDEKGFGFVELEGGEALFVHVSALPYDEKHKGLVPGARVELAVVQGTEGRNKGDQVTGPDGGPLPEPADDAFTPQRQRGRDDFRGKRDRDGEGFAGRRADRGRFPGRGHFGRDDRARGRRGQTGGRQSYRLAGDDDDGGEPASKLTKFNEDEDT